MINELNYKANGKINLGLDVVRRREDGYHEVKMIMQTVKVFDKIKITRKPSGISVKTDKDYLPEDENNLVYKAAKLLMDEFNVTEGVHIDLEKHIPVAAGMAGGSADAAAVLVGVNRMFELNLSTEDLMKRAVKIGADVPYCVLRGTALSEGIGEVLTKLPAPPKCKVLIAKPNLFVSTKHVYENLHANELTWHPDIDGVVSAIKAGDLKGMCAKLENVLETVTSKEHKEIEELKSFMKDRGALNSIMSGSGPTVFGIFDDEEKASSAYEELKKTDLAKQLFLTEFFNPGE